MTVGKIVDYGLKDSQNMGACMAPAAADTILTNLKDFGRSPTSYDRIITGDLGYIGQSILLDFMSKNGHQMRDRHLDCGMKIFDQEKQDTHEMCIRDRINALEAQVSAQTKTLDEYRAQDSDKEAQAQSAARTSESYENLMTVSSQYESGEYSDATLADTLLNVNRDALGQSGQALYDELSTEIFPGRCV